MFDEVLVKVIDLLQDFVDDPDVEIDSESLLLNDLGLESLAILSVFGELEQEYGILLPDGLLHSMTRVKDIVRAVLKAGELSTGI